MIQTLDEKMNVWKRPQTFLRMKEEGEERGVKRERKKKGVLSEFVVVVVATKG